MPLSSAVTERLMTSDGDEQPHRKRKGFELARSCRPVQRVNLPPLKRYWELGTSMGLIFGAAPLNISERLTQSSAIFAFDCETHELIPGHTSKWVTGRFGFKAQIDECAVRHLRLVQLGWAYGDRASLFPSAHKRLVKPSGFVISPGASNIHKIDDGAATVDGQQLLDILHQMLDQACTCGDEGGWPLTISGLTPSSSLMNSSGQVWGTCRKSGSTWFGVVSAQWILTLPVGCVAPLDSVTTEAMKFRGGFQSV